MGRKNGAIQEIQRSSDETAASQELNAQAENVDEVVSQLVVLIGEAKAASRSNPPKPVPARPHHETALSWKSLAKCTPPPATVRIAPISSS